MLGQIYYGIGLIFVMISLSMITKFKKINLVKEWFVKFRNITGKDPESKDFRSEEEKNLYVGITTLSTFEFIWLFFGLLTSNWYVFLVILSYGVIVNQIVKPMRFTIAGKIVSLHFLLLKFLVYLFLVINHFHLHYDILNIIKSYV